MPTEVKQKKQSIPDFIATVREALKLHEYHKTLGEQSPLTAPYFLGKKLKQTDTTPEDRGRVLSTLLKEIIEEDIVDPLHHQILTKRYFDGQSAQTVQDATGFSRARFNDYQSEAIAEVGIHLVQKVKRSIYLENPPTPSHLFEREQLSSKILEHLNTSKYTAPKSVILTGNGGVGKTSLGGQIANAWQEKSGPIFWYTIRPGLTDQLSTLFFNLAYFLDQQGQSIPWLDLVSRKGTIQPEPMLGLMRAAFAKLMQKPLLCFDDLDVLHSSQNEHRQVLEFIDALHGTVPILWIGQQVRLEADYIFVLDGLSLVAIEEFCKIFSIYIDREQLNQIQTATHGNPRLLNLFVGLYQTGESIQTILDKLPESPSIEYLLYRIITRLDETERQVLIQMAVFRGPAPSYIWLQEALTGVALQKLIERRLLQDHQDGLVSLLPVYHTIIFRTLANEQKIQLQRQAAEIRSQLAQYTEAMYHLVEAKLPTQAIKLWDKYEQQEINRGQSHTALAILRNLAQTDLPDDLQKKLYNACAKLERLHGNLDQALKDLQIELNSTPVLEIESLEIKGEIENDRGEFDQARSTFQNALVKSDALIETRIPFIHRGLSWSYLQEWELEKALHELDIASYEIDNTRGYVLEEQNRYREAQDCYLSALATADKINHVQGIAKTANNLTALYAFLGQFDLAKEYHKRAQENYQHTGAFMNEVGSNINLALTHTLSGEYTRALEVLENLEREWQTIGFTIQPSQKVLIELIRADVYTSLEDWGAAEKSLDYVFEDENITNMPDALRLRGEMYAGQGDIDAAKISIQQSIDLSNEQEMPYLEAYAWRAMGKVYLVIGNYEKAKSAFNQAIGLFNQIELHHEVEKTEQIFQDQ